MPSIDYAEARKRITLEMVLDHLGMHPMSGGHTRRRLGCVVCGQVMGKCCVYDMRNSVWYCHRCKKGGGSLELYQAWCNIPLYQATRQLFRQFGWSVPYLPRKRIARGAAAKIVDGKVVERSKDAID